MTVAIIAVWLATFVLAGVAFWLFKTRGMTLPSILDSDGRRAWSFLALLGGSFVFTVFAAISLYLVAHNEQYSLYLGLAAHVQLLLIIAVFGAQFVKRTIKAGRDGVEISDETIHDGDKITVTKE